MGLDVHFSGQLYEQRAREKFLSNIDNSTRESVIIDLEIYTVPILLGLCFLIGIGGNGALVYTICKSKRFRNVPNSFLLNIAVTNIILLMVCAPMIATSYVLDQRWPFGSVACRLVYSIPQACIAISMLSLVGLSVERYGAFAAPPKRRMTAKNRACVGMILIWVIGALCGLPLAIFAYEESSFKRISVNYEEKRVVCDVFNRKVWPDLYPKIHSIGSICFLFLVPVILCTVFYLSLSCVVCVKKQKDMRADNNSPLKTYSRSRSGTSTKTSSNTKTYTSHTIDSRTSLKKVSRKRRTMAKVTLILLIQCVLLWAPKWIYELRWYFTLEPLTFTWYLAQLFGMVAVYVNACLTPFTVVVCSRAFRHQLGKYLCCCCNCFSCCGSSCQRQKKRVDDGSSLSSSNETSGGRCQLYCCYTAAEEDNSSVDSDIGVKSLAEEPFDRHIDGGNVYQELPEHNFYDSYTLPMTQPPVHPAAFTSPRRHEEMPGMYHRPSHMRRPYVPNHTLPYPSSYHGDDAADYSSPTRLMMPAGYRPRDPHFSSEPTLHAQAPKFSKIFMPARHGYLEQATSIKEMPAM